MLGREIDVCCVARNQSRDDADPRGRTSGNVAAKAFVVVLFLFAPKSNAQPTDIRLTDVTRSSGIQFKHFDGSCGKYYIVEAMSAGLALFDYDLDGDIDIYFLNGAPQCDSPNGKSKNSSQASPPTNVLYRNDGNWKFTDVTQSANVGDRNHGLGVAIGDYDNDGDPDIYLNNFGPNVLYRNNGDGTFTDVTQESRVQNGNRVGAGTSFLDYDADGDLDLYVANYVKFSRDKHVPRTKRGYPIYGSPADYPADPDTLFRNNGDGTFADVSVESGIAAHAAPGMGMVCADYDRDGDTDVLVGNDGQVNYLFRNDGRGKFQEAGLLSGFAYDMNGKTHASMGVACADYDNDGLLDFHVTSFQGELATLYKNAGHGLLDDATNRSGAGIDTRAPVTWGNGFVDFDNDGDRDLFIACGHLYDLLDKFDQSSTYHTPNVLLENVNGRFVNVSDQCGNGLQVKATSRGTAFDDLDNDGDIDAVILNSRREPTLLRNDSSNRTGQTNHWIQFRLQGKKSNRDGVGAQVEISAGKQKFVDEVHSGHGYQGHFGTRLHFGLGKLTRVDRVQVKWIGGGTQVYKNVGVDRLVVLKESE